MSEEMQKKRKQEQSTQQHLPIAAVQEDVVTLKNGGLRAVLLVSSINFDLKSEEEQEATVGSYVSFLNGLQFPVQILIQSRPLIIDDYLDQVRAAEKQQLNDLLRLQTAEYRTYIAELVSRANIMTKRYYVIIPYDAAADIQLAFWTRLQKAVWPGSEIRLSRQDFLKRAEKLDKRVNAVATGLNNVGLQVRRLDTQSLIELYYSTYNPGSMQVQPLPDIEKLDIDFSMN
jgi:type IV secretory pathway VirB4 component